MRRTLLPLAGALLGFLVLAGFLLFNTAKKSIGVSPAAAGATRPNILFILLDDLSDGDMGCFGSTDVKTPHIDSIARDGMRFTRFYANSPICSPSRAALLTGQYPQRINLTEQLDPKSFRGIPAAAPTIPGFLKTHGYRTVHIGKWHVGENRPEFMSTRLGYDQSLIMSHDSITYLNPFLQIDDGEPVQRKGHGTALLTDAAVEFIQGSHDRPFFLNLWYMAAHTPLQPPKAWRERFPGTPRGRFLALIADADEKIGFVLDALRERGLEDSTIVIIASDNGGSRPVHRIDGALRGCKGELFEGGIRTPMLMRWPGVVRPATVNDSVITGVDFFPTIADIIGEETSGLVLDGRSFASVLRTGEERPLQDELFWTKKAVGRPGVEDFAVRSGPWKLLTDLGLPHLYDLSGGDAVLDLEDESMNVAGIQTQRVQELEEKYLRWRLVVSRIPLRVASLAGTAKRAPGNRFHFDGGPGQESGNVTMEDDRRLDISDGDFTFRAKLQLPAGPGDPSGVRPRTQAEPARRVLAEKPGSWKLSLLAGNLLDLTLLPESQPDAPVQFTSARLGLGPGRWHSVAFTIFGATVSSPTASVNLYLDGTLVASGSFPDAIAHSDGPLILGSASEASFAGGIEDPAAFLASLGERQLRWLDAE